MNVRVMIPKSVTRLLAILKEHSLVFYGSHHHRGGGKITTTVEDQLTGMRYSAEGKNSRESLQRAANKALGARPSELKKRRA